jgi:putative (di)nucleoside polyphosphate hydrolase
MPKYRQNVCVAVRKTGSDLFLLCHRKGSAKESGWQFPQGGIHRGQDLISEMRRELFEEIGTNDVTIVKVAHNRYTYDFPKGMRPKGKKYVGQTQQWVLVDFSGSDDEINFDGQPAEFDAFEWVDAKTVINRIVDFKKAVYTRAITDLGLL